MKTFAVRILCYAKQNLGICYLNNPVENTLRIINEYFILSSKKLLSS